MALPVSQIRMASRTLLLLFGMERSEYRIWKASNFMANLGRSDFLKERLFGLSNPQGNHGESIKEAHFHVDNTPTVCSAIPLLILS